MPAARKHINGASQDLLDCLKRRLAESPGDGFDCASTVKAEISQDLADSGVNIDTLFMSSVRNRVVKTVTKRHGAVSAFQAIERRIAAPLLRRRAPAEGFKDDWGALKATEETERDKVLDDLGFMIRAPVAIIATIPWVLGAGVWPFMKQVRNS